MKCNRCGRRIKRNAAPEQRDGSTYGPVCAQRLKLAQPDLFKRKRSRAAVVVRKVDKRQLEFTL